MDIFIIPLIYILLLCLFISYKSFFNLQGMSRAFVCSMFIVKAFAGIIITFNAERIYSGDDGMFFYEAGKTLYEYALEHPMSYLKLMLGIYNDSNQHEYYTLLNWKGLPYWNDNETMIKISSLIHFIAFSNMLVHSVMFSFLSFCGLTGIYKATISITKSNGFVLYLILMLFPSVVFFSSGVLKETLLLAAAGLFVYALTQFKQSTRMKVYTILLYLFLWLIKPHFVLFLTPALAGYLIAKKYFSKNLWASYAVVIAVMIVYYTAGTFVFNQILHRNAAGTIALVQQSTMKNSIYEKAESYIQPPVIAPNMISVIKNSPKAFLQTVFTPAFHFDKAGLRWKGAAAENLLVMVFVLINIVAAFSWRNEYASLHFALLLFIFSFYALVGYTCALEAAILRFKAPVLPFLIAGLYIFMLQYKKYFIRNDSPND